MMLEQVLDLGEALAALADAMFGDAGPAPEAEAAASNPPTAAGEDEVSDAA